jgi:hypothetical protein
VVGWAVEERVAAERVAEATVAVATAVVARVAAATETAATAATVEVAADSVEAAMVLVVMVVEVTAVAVTAEGEMEVEVREAVVMGAEGRVAAVRAVVERAMAERAAVGRAAAVRVAEERVVAAMVELLAPPLTPPAAGETGPPHARRPAAVLSAQNATPPCKSLVVAALAPLHGCVASAACSPTSSPACSNATGTRRVPATEESSTGPTCSRKLVPSADALRHLVEPLRAPSAQPRIPSGAPWTSAKTERSVVT